MHQRVDHMAFSKFRLFYYLDSFIVIILLHVILSVTDTYPNILTWIYLTYTIFLMKRIYDKDVDHEKSYLTMSQSKFRSIYFIDLGVVIAMIAYLTWKILMLQIVVTLAYILLRLGMFYYLDKQFQ